MSRSKPSLRDCLVPVTFPESDKAVLMVDPATRFGFIPQQNPKQPREFSATRVDSKYAKVLIPMFDWTSLGVPEESVILKVLLEAAAASPLGLPSPKSIDSFFWVKNRTHNEAVVLNTKSSVRLPIGLRVIRSEEVPLNKMLLLGKAPLVGYYVKQGNLRSVLAHDKKGLKLITFLSVD